uniref:MARVEL domain-containing protein n=1 Tax=Monodelphis domestica TaxID=13616 RepID=F7CZQ0_MONDO
LPPWWGRREEERKSGGVRGGEGDDECRNKKDGSALQALTFIMAMCFAASISAYMAAPLLEFLITLAFIILYATQYYQRFQRLNWPCLDFLRCISAIVILLVVSFAAVASREGPAIAAFVFGVIVGFAFVYDAFKTYQTEMVPRTTEGE